jgi:hypothetical protein
MSTEPACCWCGQADWESLVVPGPYAAARIRGLGLSGGLNPNRWRVLRCRSCHRLEWFLQPDDGGVYPPAA